MIVFPNCKINLGLHVTGKRADGFHNLETIFYPLPLSDILEVIVPRTPGQPSFTLSGIALDGDPAANLCVKACQLLRKDYPSIGPIQMHLHKAIPAGAGLGGGSADGAFTLQLLDRLYQLNIPAGKLREYALQLGSDCPFFIYNRPSFAMGRGELLEAVTLDLSLYRIVIVNPGIHVSTREVFARVIPAPPEHSLKDIIREPVSSWSKRLSNDLEKIVFDLHPAIAQIKSRLYSSGALYAAMSGSGSTVFAIYDQPVPHLDFPAHYFVKQVAGPAEGDSAQSR